MPTQVEHEKRFVHWQRSPKRTGCGRRVAANKDSPTGVRLAARQSFGSVWRKSLPKSRRDIVTTVREDVTCPYCLEFFRSIEE